MNRKKFFTSISLSAAGIFILKSIPFSGFTKKFLSTNGEIKIKQNPLAVSRTKTGGKHV